MKFIDSFFDTYEKRSNFIYIIFLFSSILFCINEIILGFHILFIDTYDEILNLVNQTYLQHSFFGRNALLLLNIQVFNLFEYFYNLIISIKNYEIILFIGNILCIFTSKKRTSILNITTFVFMFIFIIIIFLLAINSTSLYHLISYIRIIGIGLFIVYSLLFVYDCFEMFKTIINYIDSLKVKVIIVE